MLILTDGVKPNVFLSGRNLPLAHVMPFSDVSTYHILWSDVVLVESGALGEAMAPVKEKALAEGEGACATSKARPRTRATDDRGR